MKLRLRGSTVRVRLETEEVTGLASGRSVEEKLAVGSGEIANWTYGIAGSEDVDALTLRLSDSGLQVLLPFDVLRAWAASEEESLHGEYDGVRIDIERDRGCDHGS